MSRRARRAWYGAVAAALAIACRVPAATSTFVYDVDAVRFGTYARFPMRALVAGADTSRSQDIAFMVWLARGGGRVVLMDAGFYRERFVERWKPSDFRRPSEALAAMGVPPGAVTDIIISHVHWDHLDGADLFPRARVWIQRDEYAHYIDDAGLPRSATIDTADAAMLAAIRSSGRLRLVPGDSVEIIPGITVFLGGKHTFASQYASVRTASGPVILASDNAYLYENLEQHRPIAQTLDSLSNLRAQDRMMRLAGSPRLVVPGHDPGIFTRFPTPGGGVARIR